MLEESSRAAIVELYRRGVAIRRIARILRIPCTLVKRVIFTGTPDPCLRPRRATR